MAAPSLTPEELQDIRDVAARWGKIVARRAFGDAGPGLDADLATLEQVAVAAARGLPRARSPPSWNNKPKPSRRSPPAPPAGGRVRSTTSRAPWRRATAAAVSYREPVAHCPACRRDFFPSASGLAPGRP